MIDSSSSPRFRAVVVIPVYNHGETIGRMVTVVRQAGLRCLLIDDGSDASCAALLNQLALRHGPAVTLVRLRENQGKGAAVMTGLREATRQGYSHVLQIDADGQHDTADIGPFLASARRHPDALICGYPIFDSSVPLVRRLSRWLTHVWVWINTLSFDITDSMCGLRVYPLQSTFPLITECAIAERMAFDTEVAVRLHWRGVPVVNLPTRVTYPAGGVSHFRPVFDSAQISLLHAELFVGMLARSIGLVRRRLARKGARR